MSTQSVCKHCGQLCDPKKPKYHIDSRYDGHDAEPASTGEQRRGLGSDGPSGRHSVDTPYPKVAARTDGWVRVEDGLPKTTGVYGIYPPEQIDKDQGLNFSPRYFFANEDRNTYVGNKLAYGWVKDKNHKITHWRELPAAPGGVPK